jgi:hypothetical protein
MTASSDNQLRKPLGNRLPYDSFAIDIETKARTPQKVGKKNFSIETRTQTGRREPGTSLL